MKNRFMLLTGACVLAAMGAVAQEQTEITIYNQNLALVKKGETVTMQKGVNDVTFDEVAPQMLPESVFVYGQGVRILEQNYDYAGINYVNMLNASIGQKVKTARVNPANGENVFETATLLAVDGMSPVLAFDYGVETNFPGRVLFDKVPTSLHSTPVLRVKAEAEAAGDTELQLAYLTSGLSWKANYVAMVNDKETLALAGRAMVDNSSGSRYDNVKVNLIAGDVNIVRQVVQPRAFMKMAAVNTLANEAAMDMAGDTPVMGAPSQLSGYYIYQIPQATTLKDGQIKQVSFLAAPKVTYQKEGVILSQIYFGNNKTSYKNVHPEVVYTFKNDADGGLGLPLPEGKISFYDYDKNGSLQFVGENVMTNKAKGEEIKLTLGRFFDVYASGAVNELTKSVKRRYKKTQTDKCFVAETVYDYDITYSVVNKSADDVVIRLKQNLPSTTVKIIQESVKGYAGEGSLYEWQLSLKAGETQTIKVKAERFAEERDCR